MIPFTEGQLLNHEDKCIINMEETHLGPDMERKDSIDSDTEGTCSSIQRVNAWFLFSFQKPHNQILGFYEL